MPSPTKRELRAQLDEARRVNERLLRDNERLVNSRKNAGVFLDDFISQALAELGLGHAGATHFHGALARARRMALEELSR